MESNIRNVFISFDKELEQMIYRYDDKKSLRYEPYKKEKTMISQQKIASSLSQCLYRFKYNINPLIFDPTNMLKDWNLINLGYIVFINDIHYQYGSYQSLIDKISSLDIGSYCIPVALLYGEVRHANIILIDINKNEKSFIYFEPHGSLHDTIDKIRNKLKYLDLLDLYDSIDRSRFHSIRKGDIDPLRNHKYINDFLLLDSFIECAKAQDYIIKSLNYTVGEGNSFIYRPDQLQTIDDEFGYCITFSWFVAYIHYIVSNSIPNIGPIDKHSMIEYIVNQVSKFTMKYERTVYSDIFLEHECSIWICHFNRLITLVYYSDKCNIPAEIISDANITLKYYLKNAIINYI